MRDKRQNVAIKEFLRALASAVLKTPADIRAASDATGLSKSALEQMKIYAKGSASSWVGLLAYSLDISPKDLPAVSAKFRGAISTTKPNELDTLIEEARRKFSDPELYVWLRLLLARYEIEENVGLRKSRKS